MTEQIKKILLAAILAPSGENSQPWRFRVSGNKIELFNNPDSDQSLYNTGQYGSLVACGAALENLVITASAEGLKANVALLPQAGDRNLVATIELATAPVVPDPLCKYIGHRVTNRKAYTATPLSDHELRQLKISGQIRLTSDRSQIKQLTTAGCVNEKVMFNHRLLHQFFLTM